MASSPNPDASSGHHSPLPAEEETAAFEASTASTIDPGAACFGELCWAGRRGGGWPRREERLGCGAGVVGSAGRVGEGGGCMLQRWGHGEGGDGVRPLIIQSDSQVLALSLLLLRRLLPGRCW